MHDLAVKAGEIDALAADGHRPDEAVDAGVLRVRNGDSAADAGAAEFLALENRLDDALVFILLDFARFAKRLHHFSDGALFVDGLQFGEDSLATDKVRKSNS